VHDIIEMERDRSGMVDRRTVEEGSFLADGLAGSAPSIVYGTGRVCIEPSCSVKLSRYNSTEWCALHESPASTQRPYETSTRQPRGRRRNSRARRAAAGQMAAGAATKTAVHPEPAESPAKTPRKSSRRTAA
jgi:hypothetical protein